MNTLPAPPPTDHQAIALLTDLVATPSPSHHEGEAVACCVRWMRSLGLCAEVDGAGSAVGTLDLAGNARVVNGIVDIGAFESPPFKLVIFDAAPGAFVGLGTNRLDVYVPRTNLVYGSFLPTNAVFRSGYMPVGWYSSPGGGGIAIQAETPFVSPDTHTVYMHWLRRGFMIKLF